MGLQDKINEVAEQLKKELHEILNEILLEKGIKFDEAIEKGRIGRDIVGNIFVDGENVIRFISEGNKIVVKRVNCG